MLLRDLFWEYPIWVSKTIKKFSVVVTIFVGCCLAALIYWSLLGVTAWKQDRVIFSGMLNYGIIGRFDAVDPLDVGADPANQMVTKLMYNSLVFADESGRLYPELAETWAVSPDGKEYSFFLRKGIRWHDGVELTAKDIVTTFELLKTGDNQTGLSSIASEVEVTARSAYEVVFRLKQVNSAFLELASIPILPAHVYGSMSYSRVIELGESIQPIGTGPYLFQKHEGEVLYFRANPRYFKGVPKIQIIAVHFFTRYELAEKEFLSGRIHVLSPLASGQAQKIQQLDHITTRVSTAPIVQANNTRLLLFSLKSDANYIGKDVQIRKAIAHAVDRGKIVELVPGSIPAFGPYPSSSFAYSPVVETIGNYSVNEANTLLDRSGWKYPYSGAAYRVKNGQELRITLTLLKSETNEKTAEAIRDQLLKIGVNLLLNEVSSEDMVQRVLPEKEFELLLFEIQSGVDPDQYALWHSSQSEFPALNLSGYNSPVIDNFLEMGRLQPNIDKRIAIYHSFQEELVKDATAIFLYHPAYFETYFDIINRTVPKTVITSGDGFATVHLWTIEPGWRNWQTR